MPRRKPIGKRVCQRGEQLRVMRVCRGVVTTNPGSRAPAEAGPTPGLASAEPPAIAFRLTCLPLLWSHVSAAFSLSGNALRRFLRETHGRASNARKEAPRYKPAGTV